MGISYWKNPPKSPFFKGGQGGFLISVLAAKQGPGLDDTTILGHLEALAQTLEVQVRYESLESETTFPTGGLCRIKDKKYIIVNESASTGEKVRTIAKALRRFDLSQIYLKPALRDFLETGSD
jgi:hypothetical protein